MAVLGQNIGQTKRLGLSNAFDASNKHVVFVKLTDSSLEALQNYIRKQGNHSSANNKVGKKRPEKKIIIMAWIHKLYRRNSGSF